MSEGTDEIGETVNLQKMLEISQNPPKEEEAPAEEPVEDQEEEKKEEEEAPAEEPVEEEQEKEEPVEEEESPTEGQAEILEEPGEIKFKPKDLTLKMGEEDYTIPNNAVIEIPVDGGIRRLHLQEVINRASGDISVEQRITQVETERRRLQAAENERVKEWEERQEKIKVLNDTVETLTKLTMEGKPEDLLVYCARRSGKNPVDVLTKFLQDSTQWAGAFASMDEQEQKHWFKGLELLVKEQEIKEEELKRTTRQQKEQEEQENRQILGLVDQKLTVYEASFEDFKKTAALFKASGLKYTSDDPKGRVSDIFNLMQESRVYEAANTMGHGLIDDKNLLIAVYRYTQAQDIHSPKEIRKILAGFVDQAKDKVARNLSEKVLERGSLQKAKTALRKKEEKSDPAKYSITAFERRARG